MADNSTLPATGEVIRTVDKTGKKTQVVTLDLGGSGAEALTSGSIPVTGSFYPATQPVSGTVGISGTVPVSGTFYQATQPVSIASMPSTPVTGTFWQATQPVSIASMPSTPVTGTFWPTTQPVSSTQLPAALAANGGMKIEGVASGVAVPVSGTFWQATQPISGSVTVTSAPTTAVTGTFWQATQPVSGPLTDTQLRASAVPVSGTFWQATQPVSIAGTVTVSNGQTQPLTDTQLRASAVPVSLASLPALATGSNTIGAVTGPSAAPLALDASLTGHSQTFKAVTVATNLSTANATVTLTIAAAGASLFHYITRIRITNINPTATAIAGSAVTLSYTSTNIPGSLAWTAGNALAAGAEKVVVDEILSQPIKTSVANTATTIVAPAIGAGGLCRITVYYYSAA